MSSGADIAAAAALFQKNDLPAARVACEAILAKRPDDAEAMHLLGLVQRRTGDVVNAEALLQRSIELRPDNDEFRINLSNLYVAVGRLADAELTLRAVLEQSPGNAVAALALARVYNRAGVYAQAQQLAQSLLSADAQDSQAWVVLGDALRSQERLPEAEACFAEALRLRPDYAIAHHNLGAVLARQRRGDDALEHLNKAAQLGVQGPEIDTNRAAALIELQAYEDAEALLESVVDRSPDFIDAHERLAKLRYMRGESAWADALRDAAQTAAGPRLAFLLGDLQRRAGNHDAALEILSDLDAAHPGTAGIESSIAVVLQERGELDQALERIRKAHATNAFDAGIAENFVAILLQNERPDEAMPVIRDWQQRRALDQRWLTWEATAARFLQPQRFEDLFNCERFVRQFDISPPDGLSAAQFNAQLAEFLNARHALRAHPLDQSLRHGTQTARELMTEQEPVVRQFFAALREPLAQYCSELGREESHPYTRRNTGNTRIVGSWSVRLQSGGFHVNHIHPQGWISSAYYVDVPQEVSDEQAQTGWIGFAEPRLPIPGHTLALRVQPRAGSLVLFPSYLWHGTTPIAGSEPRMTIAFDALPT